MTTETLHAEVSRRGRVTWYHMSSSKDVPTSMAYLHACMWRIMINTSDMWRWWYYDFPVESTGKGLEAAG